MSKNNLEIAKECGAVMNDDEVIYTLDDGSVAFMKFELDAYTARICADKDEVITALRMGWEEETRNLAAANAQITMQAEAFKAVLPFVVTQEVACHGLKCREPVCMSCDYDSAENAQRACDKHGEAQQALSATAESVAAWLREHDAKVLEVCAKMCDEKSMQFEHKTENAENDDEVTDLRSRAWDFCVMAAELRATNGKEST